MALLLVALLLVAPAAAAPAADAVPTDPHARVAHHVHEAEQLARHFEDVKAKECPRFASKDEWKSYFDGEVDRMVLMHAHVEQAWLEAKRTKDDDLRRTAKAPRKHFAEARGLVDKLQECAHENGSSFAPLMVFHKIEREVPKRQAEIALPAPQ